MEYGYIKDTTVQAIADGFREKGIILPVKHKIEYEYYATDNVVGTDIPEISGKHNRVIVSIPEAESLELDCTLIRAMETSGASQISFYTKTGGNANFEEETNTGFAHQFNFYKTQQKTFTFKERNHVEIDFMDWGIEERYCGIIVHAYALDLKGNRMLLERGESFYEDKTPSELVEALNEYEPIKAVPDEAFFITGDCELRFCGWDWFIENYGNKVTTKDITNLDFSFQSVKVDEVPFILNIKKCNDFNQLFTGSTIKVCPKIRGTFDTTRMPMAVSGIEGGYIRDMNDLFEPEMFDYLENLKITSAYYAQYGFKFSNCYSLRTVPAWWRKLKLNKESTAAITSSTIFNGSFGYCYALDEALDIPVWTCTKPFTSNLFGGTFDYTYRLKDFTFETDNGAPIVANWKSQTISLNNITGYSGNNSSILDRNSGITADKEVKDDATYQALKNDPDWFTAKPEYSRYNHDSAVRTINSLPDTSAYLATAGGTNTIKFTGKAGSKTDGGAINTLTAEEIAVATAKGWTVTFG